MTGVMVSIVPMASGGRGHDQSTKAGHCRAKGQRNPAITEGVF